MLLGICEESCNYGRKEVEGVSLATMKLKNGHDVWWIPNVTNLPIAKLNDPKIPLVSTVIYMYIYERIRIRNKGKLKKSGRLIQSASKALLPSEPPDSLMTIPSQIPDHFSFPNSLMPAYHNKGLHKPYVINLTSNSYQLIAFYT